MKILLTGATGYLGSHIAKYLLEHNHKVVILKKKTSSMERLKKIKNNLIYYDLDKLDLATPFRQQGNFDAIIHTSTSYGKNGETINEIFEANTLFPTRLLETSILFKTKAFINTDTYYNTDEIMRGDLSGYILSKKSFINKAKLFAFKKNIKIINLRLEHIYGPGDSQTKFVNWLVSSLSKGNKKINLTKGQQKRDMIFIDDVVNAFGTILINISKIKRYYVNVEVGCGSTVTLREFIELAHKLSKSKSKLIFGGIPYLKNEIMSSKADNKILKSFGWNCKVSILEGLNKVIRSI